jgi:hypothetical protein
VERMAVTHSVDGGASASAVRWYELDIAGDRSVSVANQGTYAPTTASRWMGSAARDAAGNLAVGYSLSSATTYPSLAWAGRLPTDPPDTLAQTERIAVAGGGSQDGRYTRYGDYSALALDPVDECTFWYAGEYYASSGEAAWRTRISSFSFPSCQISAPASPTNAQTLTFGIAFGVSISGLEAADLSATGTAVGCTIGTPAGSGRTWTVDVTGCGDGTVILALEAGSVLGADGLARPAADVTSTPVLVDRTAPSVSAPSVTLRTGTSLSSASRTAMVPVIVTWTRIDSGGAPITGYVLQRSTDPGAPWVTVSSTITTMSYATTVPSTGTARFRVRADDSAGNQGTPADGRTLTPRLVQQSSTSVRYRGSWTRAVYGSYSGGSARYARASGASASYTFTGRSIAFVAKKGTTRGKARIYVNGTLQTTVDLYRSSSLYRAVVWQRTWPTSASRTIRIVVAGTGGRPRVDLDAFIVVR